MQQTQRLPVSVASSTLLFESFSRKLDSVDSAGALAPRFVGRGGEASVSECRCPSSIQPLGGGCSAGANPILNDPNRREPNW